MSRRSLKNVGIIGLGIIGRRVAENLRRRGFSVFVWNRTPRPFPNFVGSPAEIAQLADYIQIFVSDDAALLDMAEQLRPSLKAHHIVMAHSTVAPHNMRAAAEVVQRRGAQFLDAPFTGSRVAAEKGELVYYIGGDESAFKRARPVLEASSKEIIEIGEIGQATIIKIATNMVTAATVQVAAEALALVQSSGLPLEKFVAALRGNAINSPTLTMKLPKMIARDFDPHFSVKHMLKDVEIASRLGRSYDLRFGATETARDSLLEEARRNHGDDDFSALVRAFFPDRTAASEMEETDQQPTLDLAERKTAPAEEKSTTQPVEEKLEAEAPEAKTEPQMPEAKTEAQTPEAKTEAQTPEVKTEAQTPEVKTEAQTPEAKTEAQTPEVKTPAQTPEVNIEAETLEVEAQAPEAKVEEVTPEVKAEAPEATVEAWNPPAEPMETKAPIEPAATPHSPAGMEELSFAFDDPAAIDEPEPKPAAIASKPADEFPKSFAQEWLDEGPAMFEPEPIRDGKPPPVETPAAAIDEVQIDDILLGDREEEAPVADKETRAAKSDEPPSRTPERERVGKHLSRAKAVREPSPIAAPAEPPLAEEEERPRGFFRRLFSKGPDY